MDTKCYFLLAIKNIVIYKFVEIVLYVSIIIFSQNVIFVSY